MELIDKITHIVDDYSGGIKMPQLLVILIGKWDEKGSDDLISDVETAIMNCDHLGILEYPWDLGGGHLRMKQFIHRIKY